MNTYNFDKPTPCPQEVPQGFELVTNLKGEI